MHSKKEHLDDDDNSNQPRNPGKFADGDYNICGDGSSETESMMAALKVVRGDITGRKSPDTKTIII
jgi:hypothetical protein